MDAIGLWLVIAVKILNYRFRWRTRPPSSSCCCIAFYGRLRKPYPTFARTSDFVGDVASFRFFLRFGAEVRVMQKQSLLVAAVSSAILMAVSSSMVSASQILTVTSGDVDGLYEFGAACDTPPTWDGTAPVGHDSSSNAILAGWDKAGGVGYLDFGGNYADVKIEQVWTHNMPWRSGPAFPFAAAWWGDTPSATPTALTETQINFQTQAFPGGGSVGLWLKDSDFTANPIVPRGRYLMLQAPAVTYDDSNEFALVGTVPEPASLGLLGAIAGGLLMRRRQQVG
jgi:hypothetical protein